MVNAPVLVFYNSPPYRKNTNVCLDYLSEPCQSSSSEINAVLTNLSFCCVFSGLPNGRIPARVPVAHMSTGPTGGGRENQLYFLLVGATCVGGAVYVSWLSLS